MNRERAAENHIASVLENTLGSTGRCRSASNLCYGLGFAQRLPSNRGKKGEPTSGLEPLPLLQL